MARKEHIRAVIWPRKPVENAEGKKLYRYAIAGMIVTDREIPELERKNEDNISQTIVSSDTNGELLEALRTLPPRRAVYRIGTADDFLTSMDRVVSDEEDQGPPKKKKKKR